MRPAPKLIRCESLTGKLDIGAPMVRHGLDSNCTQQQLHTLESRQQQANLVISTRLHLNIAAAEVQSPKLRN